MGEQRRTTGAGRTKETRSTTAPGGDAGHVAALQTANHLTNAGGHPRGTQARQPGGDRMSDHSLMSDHSPAAIREATEDREATRRGDQAIMPLPDHDLDIGV